MTLVVFFLIFFFEKKKLLNIKAIRCRQQQQQQRPMLSLCSPLECKTRGRPRLLHSERLQRASEKREKLKQRKQVLCNPPVKAHVVPSRMLVIYRVNDGEGISVGVRNQGRDIRDLMTHLLTEYPNGWTSNLFKYRDTCSFTVETDFPQTTAASVLRPSVELNLDDSYIDIWERFGRPVFGNPNLPKYVKTGLTVLAQRRRNVISALPTAVAADDGSTIASRVIQREVQLPVVLKHRHHGLPCVWLRIRTVVGRIQ